MNLTFKSLMLAGAFATGFWAARDAHARDWALRRLKTAAATLVYRAVAAAPAWKAPEPPPAPVEIVSEPPPAPEAPPEEAPAEPPRAAPKAPNPPPEEAYLDALRIIEAGPADHGVR